MQLTGNLHLCDWLAVGINAAVDSRHYRTGTRGRTGLTRVNNYPDLVAPHHRVTMMMTMEAARHHSLEHR